MVHAKIQSPQNVTSQKVKVKGVRKWQKAYSCLSLSLSLALVAFLAISSTSLEAKKHHSKRKLHLSSHKSRNALWLNKENDLIFTDKQCQNHNVCLDCPKENEITGWWLNTIKGNGTDTVTLWNIRFEGNELRAKIYAGYQGRYREWTPEDVASMQAQASPFWGQYYSFPTDEFAVIADTSNSWLLNPTDPSDPNFLSPQQRTARLNGTENPDVLYVYMYDVSEAYQDELVNMLRLVRLDEIPEIETFDNPAFIDNTNPVHILENLFNMWLLDGNPQMASDYLASDYPGFLAYTAHKDQLLTTGVSYNSTVKDVWRTRTDSPTFFPFPLSTTLITVQPPNPRIGARATVTGFLPPYDILNNPINGWELGIADNDNGRNGSEVYGASYYDGADEKFMLTLLDIDTSALPPYDPNIHGIGQVTVVVLPVTAATEYKELTAAVHDLQSFMDRTTHTSPRGFFDRNTFRVFDTFADVQAGLDAGIASRFTLRSRGYGGTRSGASYVDIWFQDTSTFPAIPSNDPTGLSLNDPEWVNPVSPDIAYNIDGFNYLDLNRTFNIYWALTGPEIPGSPITGQRLVDITGGYYKTPGSKFIFQASDYYGAAPDPLVWTLYGDYQDGFDYRNALMFGIIDPAFTCGETIAYITLVDENSFDPAFGVSASFNDFTDPSNGIPGPLGPTIDAFATMLEKLNEFSPTSYIINIRGNGGGWNNVTIALASFFGSQLNEFEAIFPFASNGNQPSISDQQIQDEAQFVNFQETINQSKIAYNDAIATLHPNAMVRNQGQNVIILTDTNAASNGDYFPHALRNNDAVNPGNIGFGVTSYIVGDIDGRNFGYSPVARLNLFTNASHNLFQDGIPVSAYNSGIECVAGALRAGDNNYEFSNQNPVIAPDILINNDIEATLWLDVGKVGPYPKNPLDGGVDSLVLPLSTGKTQPVYADNTTWRDRALEACIMTAVGDCFSIRSTRDAKVAKKAKREKPVVKKEAEDKAEVERIHQAIKERIEERR